MVWKVLLGFMKHSRALAHICKGSFVFCPGAGGALEGPGRRLARGSRHSVLFRSGSRVTPELQHTDAHSLELHGFMGRECVRTCSTSL